MLHLQVSDRAAFDEAAELIASFGEHAASEAALRADRSRHLGNLIHFCRWRSVERTILMLGQQEATGPLH